MPPQPIKVKLNAQVYNIILQEDDPEINNLNSQKISLEEQIRNQNDRIKTNMNELNTLNQQILARYLVINNGILPI